jgi:signal transduction histidine kinase
MSAASDSVIRRGRSSRLGLALVRQIARRHGGEARCLGDEGGGSCFVVNLPT